MAADDTRAVIPCASMPPRKKPQSKKDQLAEAIDPQTPQAQLDRLAGSRYPDVCVAVAANPSASIYALKKLIFRFTHQVEGNAAWQLAVLADPSLADEQRRTRAIMSSDPEELRMLAQVGSLDIKRTVARNRSTPPDALALLARTDDAWLERTVAENPRTPPGVLAGMADGPRKSDLIYTLIENPATPEGTLRKLLHEHPPELREFLLSHALKNPALPGDLVGLAVEHPKLWKAIAIHLHAPREILKRLASEGPDDVQIAVALNPATPPETLDALAHTGHAGVRQAVAENPSCSTPTLVVLAGDPSLQVRKAAACHKNTPLYLRTSR